jgi:hypothetical protein
MRIPIAIAVIVSAVGCSHALLHQSIEPMVGLWQFPDRGVWVRIDADGSAFQCRIAPGGTVFVAKGRLVAGKTIVWNDIWGVDRVVFNANSITLEGEWGAFTYVRATSPMNGACFASDRTADAHDGA